MTKNYKKMRRKSIYQTRKSSKRRESLSINHLI